MRLMLLRARKLWRSSATVSPTPSTHSSLRLLRNIMTTTAAADTTTGRTNTTTTAGKVITCYAAVARGPNEALELEEIEVDPPQKMEVRLKILYTSVCHTDISAWQSKNEGQRAFPRILGHEAVAVVESVGEGVNDVREGDHVIPIFNGECGHCVYCKSGQGGHPAAAPTNLCQHYRVDPFRTVMRNDGKCRFRSRTDGGPIFHFLNTSTFSQYTVLDSACVVNILRSSDHRDAEIPPPPPSPLHLKMMSLFSCCVSTGVGAAWNVANVQAGSSVAIFGLGALGLTVAQGARVRGASKIIGVDINPHKFIKGKLMGVTDFINPTDSSKPVHERIREMTGGGRGVDYSLECVGNPQLLREAFLSSHDGWGKTVLVGIYTTPQLLPLHPMELFDGRSITGTIFGNVRGKSQLHHLAHRCLQPDMKMEELITHELPFEKINDAFQLLITGKALRCILQL